jgi:acid phosphatase (class A)
LLAEAVPDKADAILALGRGIGWRRVLLGHHYPTDIYAGRCLGQAVVRELKANPAFVKDFAQVKDEIAAALRAPGGAPPAAQSRVTEAVH